MTKTIWTARNLTREEMNAIRDRITAETGIAVRVELSGNRNAKGTVNILPPPGEAWTHRQTTTLIVLLATASVKGQGGAERGPITERTPADSYCYGFKYLVKVEAAA